MRQTLMFVTMAVLTACGSTGNTPWDENRDGLISACEGLNPQACDATPGCEPAAVVCTLECRDDGRGGCLPCIGTETCRPTPTPPPFDCSQLSATQCAADARCELLQAFTTPADDRNGAPAAPEFRQPDTQVCVTRRPASCESLSADVCLARPGCALESSDASPCFMACEVDDETCGCTPAQLRCVTQPPPDDCFGRDENSCTLDGRCVLESTAVCDVYCEPGTECPPCSVRNVYCVPAPPPDVCGSRDANSCTFDGRCVLVQGPVCDAVCDPNGSCPPCANPTVYCVPAPPPDACGSRDLTSCELDGRCMVQAWACPAICKPDGNGGCEPCDAPPAVCVPAYQPDECSTRDLTSCEYDGRCMVQAWACPAICIPDGNGGCEPCDAPPVACVPVTPPSRCEGLDRATCSAVGCSVVELACDLACRDDGHGGCLPCDAFLCTDGGSSGGGGSVPPRP